MIHFEHVTFTYPEASRPALRQVSLDIPEAQLCLIIGPSGAGKSTLLRCTNGLVPHFSGGTLTGSIRVNGLDPVQLSPQIMSRHVGFVFQDPEAQFVVDRVEDEVAFALENAAIPPQEMDARVGQALRLLELEALRTRRLETLSGGERQRVAIAAALALRPQVLALDEPTSQLDPHGADEVLQALVRLNRELGLTILLAEHRLERVLPYSGQVIYIDQERPGALSGPPRQVLAQVDLNPPIMALSKALGRAPLPLTVEEALPLAYEILHSGLPSPLLHARERALPAQRTPKVSTPFLQAENLEVSFDGVEALRSASLELHRGEIAVLLGPNGAGKTTLLRCLVGLTRPQGGRVLLEGQDIAGREVAEICRQVGYLPQDPNALLFADTVMEELSITLKNHQPSKARQRKLPVAPSEDASINALLAQLGLGDKAAAYPRDLSAGERQRVALGAVMVPQPGALLLDEPTRGLDYAAKRGLLHLLRGWREQGMAILLVTHDVELAAAAADRAILMQAGYITDEGSPQDVLGSSPLFAPQIARLFPGTGWLQVEDVIGGAK